MPPTPEINRIGVKIFNLILWDFQIFWDGRGPWAWPEVGSMKLGFSDGLGKVCHLPRNINRIQG